MGSRSFFSLSSFFYIASHFWCCYHNISLSTHHPISMPLFSHCWHSLLCFSNNFCVRHLLSGISVVHYTNNGTYINIIRMRINWARARNLSWINKICARAKCAYAHCCLCLQYHSADARDCFAWFGSELCRMHTSILALKVIINNYKIAINPWW